MPRRMKNSRDHDHLLALEYFVNYSVAKAFEVTPANILAWMAAAIEQRILSKAVEECPKFANKSVTQTLPPAVIPCSDFDKVFLYFRS